MSLNFLQSKAVQSDLLGLAPKLFRTQPICFRALTMPPKVLRGMQARTMSRFIKSGSYACSNTQASRLTYGIRWNSTNFKAKDPSKKLGTLARLSKEYGWSVVGIYAVLSILDYPLCFLAVHSLGQEKIADFEHSVKAFFGFDGKDSDDGNTDITTKKNDNPSLWTEAVIAYGIHKGLMVVRVPLTAAITPSIVKLLRSYGWNIGKTSGKELGRKAKSSWQKFFGGLF
ncbi:uncharacterized protein V1510DRAFT_420315 [Dipodascopsis tothii]|uniref:uncharacterized protein n=1 Tax=Dipodascopsis tothii TaxID=44089 RepID=UPI0034CFDF92